MFQAFRYDGKRALVVGGASGMGAATGAVLADAGAEVVVMDIAEPAQSVGNFIEVNLADRSSIDKALDACGEPVHALFCCAGVADGTPGIERINFIGHRHLMERLVSEGTLGRGGAIGWITSAAGLGWETHLEDLRPYLETPDFETAAAWIAANGHADYMWSKQSICAYVSREAFRYLKQGIRINALAPGPTDTPLARANRDMWLEFGADYRQAAGVGASTPMEQALPLVFLCSDAAISITGTILVTDCGYITSGLIGSFPPATDAARFLSGRYT